MTASQKTLTAIFVLQIVLIFLVRSPFGGSTTGPESQALYPELDVDVLSRVELSDEEDSVTLVRRGVEWQVDEFDGFPASNTKVSDLLADLAGLEVRRPVVRSAKYHAAFKVKDDENEGRVRVWPEGDDTPVVDLIVGNSGNYRSLRVRRSDQTEVYEVSDLAAYDVRADAESWVDKRLVHIEPDTVHAVTVVNQSGAIKLIKQETEWKVSDDDTAALDQEKVAALVRTITGLNIASPLGPTSEHGPSAQHAETTITLGSSHGTAVILIGAKRPDDDTRRSITAEGSGFSGEIWDSSVKSLLEKELADLLAA